MYVTGVCRLKRKSRIQCTSLGLLTKTEKPYYSVRHWGLLAETEKPYIVYVTGSVGGSRKSARHWICWLKQKSQIYCTSLDLLAETEKLHSVRHWICWRKQKRHIVYVTGTQISGLKPQRTTVHWGWLLSASGQFATPDSNRIDIKRPHRVHRSQRGSRRAPAWGRERQSAALVAGGTFCPWGVPSGLCWPRWPHSAAGTSCLPCAPHPPAPNVRYLLHDT